MLGRTDMLKDQSAQDAKIIEGLLEARESRENAVADVLAQEGARALAADKNAQQFAADFNVIIWRYFFVHVRVRHRFTFCCVNEWYLIPCCVGASCWRVAIIWRLSTTNNISHLGYKVLVCLN